MEGLLKKVNTDNVVVTPNSNTKIKLSELNKILNEMTQGEQAVKRMAELDQSRGLQDPADVARRLRGDVPVTTQSGQGALGDTDLANNLRQQAAKMDAEAKGLMAEAARLMKEAAQMDGAKAESLVPKAKKTTAKKTKVSA